MKHITRIRKICNEIEKVENYDKAVQDNFKGWILHHRLEITLSGEFAHTSTELQTMNMYYNRPYFELIFLPKAEHTVLHNRANHLAGLYEKRKQKISNSVKLAYKEGRLDTSGKNNGMFGKSPWNKK
jgi:hypothetical protein